MFKKLQRSEPFTNIDSHAALDRVAEHSMREPVVLYKHSLTCGVSFRARRQLLQLTEADDPPVYEVVIQQARSVSNEIAQWLDVRHESPQVIVLHQRQPVFNASHGRVTAEAVRDAIATLTSV